MKWQRGELRNKVLGDKYGKIGIILETEEFEKAWNAFGFAKTAKKQNHEVKVFWWE